jgi:hypothetical protein
LQIEKKKQFDGKTYVVKSTEEGKRNSEGVKLIKICYIHVWKYHSETPSYNQYKLIKTEEKNRKNRFINIKVI